MSEDNKTVELKDEELENVTGGEFRIMSGEISSGDCHESVKISAGYCVRSVICSFTNCKYHKK